MMLDPVAGIIDYGSGNIQALKQALRCLGYESIIISDSYSLRAANCSHVILPGVGSFDACRSKLTSRDLDNAIVDLCRTGSTPLLGICVGMQLLADSSEEGQLSGLSLVSGRVEALASLGCQIIPHVGWNTVDYGSNSVPLLGTWSTIQYSYFIHSYYFRPSSDSCLYATTSISPSLSIPCFVGDGLIMGCQFHPEKSHFYGLRLLDRFMKISC